MPHHDRDIDEEIEFHLEMRTRDLVRDGLSPAAAAARARREFGDVAYARRSLARAAGRARRLRRVRRLAVDLAGDIVHGVRGLRHAPGFGLVAVATLGLGIGAATAIFSVVNAVLLRPIYPDGDRLVRVWETHGPDVPRNVVSRGNFLDWKDRSETLGSWGAFMLDFGYGMTGEGDPVQVTASVVSPGVFEALRVGPLLGRVFAAGDDGAADEVVLSYGFWRERFGEDAAVLGRRIVLDGDAYTVVGVMPGDFAFPTRATDLWLPMRFPPSARSSRDAHMLHVVARLKPGATVESAQAEMAGLAEAIRREHPAAMEGWGVRVLPFRADLVRAVRPLVLLLLGAVLLVLAIACVNVANLVLARGTRRRIELAVRAALGAGRGRIARQLLTEHALLAVLGGAAGVLAAVVLTDLLLAFAPPGVPLLDGARIDGVALVFAISASAVSVLLFGLAPAIRAARTDVQGVLRGATAAGGRPRARRLLLIAEIALSVVLLVAAGLLVRSFARLHAADAGLDADGVLTAALNLPAGRYRGTDAHAAFYDAVLERIRATPGVVSAGGTSEPPVVGFAMMRSVMPEGYTFRPDELDDAYYRAVTSDFFETLRIPLREGRLFDASDRAGARPVLVVNQAFVRRFWPDGRALGRRVRLSDDGPWYEVVGVVADVRQNGLDVADGPAVYAPYAAKDWTWLTWMTLLVRTSGEPAAVAPAVRQAVWNVDPALPIQEIATLRELYRADAAPRRFTLILVGAFAGVGLLLGTIGIYGVVAYTVASRTREIGVRVALGARTHSVVGLVLADGLRLAIIGTALGVAAALAGARLIRGLLFDIEPADPTTFAVVPLVVLAIAVLACLLPAWKATRLDPVSTLR